MKTLQNNFTTPDQSKRLLELGVPADSADCYYCNEYKYKPTVEPGSIHLTINVRESQHDLSENLFYDDFYIPCWSVGRLMEIVDIVSAGDNYLSQNWDNTLSAKETSGSYVNYIVEYIVDNIAQLNFLKLED